jgi:hypothetical protein
MARLIAAGFGKEKAARRTPADVGNAIHFKTCHVVLLSPGSVIVTAAQS